MKISIEKMEPKHLELMNLEDFDDFWTLGILENELKSETSYYIIATYDENILGFAGLNFILDEAHITNIVVKQNYRNCGIGAKLIQDLIKKAEENSSLITLEVNENNLPAIHLYEKYNFNILGRRKKYYNNLSDAIIMTRYF